MKPRFSLLGAALVALVVVSAGCTGQALCEKEKECRNDPPGEDFLRICSVEHDGMIRALRTNKEEECHILADARLRYDACRAQLSCRDYNEQDHNGECDDERDDYEDAFDDAESQCGTLD